MGSSNRKNYILFALIACMAFCLLCLSGCGGFIQEDCNPLTTAEGTKPNDEASIDACSKAVNEFIQRPYYHLDMKSENDSILTQIYCNGENYLASDYDGSLQLASAVKYDGVYAVAERGRYVVTEGDQTAYFRDLIQIYDILGKWNLEIKKVEYESDRVTTIHAEWDENDDGLLAHIQGRFVYEFADNGELSSALVEKERHIDGQSVERSVYSLVDSDDTREIIAYEIDKVSKQIAQPDETDGESEHGDSMLVPPSNTTDYDLNFLLGSTEMKWNFFDNSWSFALCGEDSTPEGITLVHKPAGATKDMVLEYGQEYFLESWDGNRWNLFFRGSIPAELSERTTVFSGSTITEPVSVQINWGSQCGTLEEGKYRVGMYYTATKSSGEQEKKLCYTKFLVYGLERDRFIKKCSSALEEILRKDTYHIQRTDYMLEHRLNQDAHYYVSNIWKSKQNYYSEVTYYYNSNGEIKSNLGMLLWDRKGYDWNTLLSPDKLWSERDDLTEASFQTWAFGLDCTTKTLEKVIQTENSITFVFPPASVSGRRDSIQGKEITYCFDQNDELVRVTLEYILENQEKMMEVELLVEDISNESAEKIIKNQYAAAAPVN